MESFKVGDIICDAAAPNAEREIIGSLRTIGENTRLITRPIGIRGKYVSIYQLQSRWHCKPADLKQKRIEYLMEEAERSRRYADMCDNERNKLTQICGFE